jgi:predicted DNA-binding WGR domain protein
MPTMKAMLAKYATIRDILDRAEEIENEEPVGANYRSKPLPPASPTEIAAYERKLGCTLPPSYREFLLLHNGWQAFWGGTWIAGVSGMALAFVKKQLKDADDWVSEGSGWDPKRDLVIGADDNGDFLVLAPKANAKGERAVLDCESGVVQDENTFKSFADLVATQLRCRTRDVAELPKALRTISAAKAKRYEFKRAGSSKFWSVAVAGTTVTYAWGRIGTDGQSKTKKLASPAAVKREVDALVAEKTAKGYRPVRQG